jgi:hypothetical protein
MSIGIMPYLTDLAAIRRLQTSGACVIEEIVARQRDRIDHAKPGVEHAMRAIVRGHLYEDGTGGSTFGYAVEQFCDYYGKMQVNTEMCPFGFNALKELDAMLRETGVTELLPASFIGWDPPIPLSERPDFPSITTFDVQVCRGGAAQYAAAIPALADSPWRRTVMQVAGWLRQSRDTGRGLVLFCY